MARKQKQKQEREESEDPSLHEEQEDDNDEEMGEEDGPPVIDPYEVLGLEVDATDKDVKSAYRKLALKHHPDKAGAQDKDAAHKKFQEVAFAYAVLSDERRRKRYDLTGSTAETLEDDEDFDWLSFYREQFQSMINEESIKKVANDYKHSGEERRDIIKAYKRCRGSLEGIYNTVMLSDILEDDDRFRKIIDEEIEKGTIESFPEYAKETDASRKKAKEQTIKQRKNFDEQQAKREANASSSANGQTKTKSHMKSRTGSNFDLAALIQQRQQSRAGNFFDALEAKYAPPSRGSKRATPMEEPPEEAFQATAARKKQKSSRGKKAKKQEEDEEAEMDLGEEDVGESEEEEEVSKKRKPTAHTKVKRQRKTRSTA